MEKLKKKIKETQDRIAYDPRDYKAVIELQLLKSEFFAEGMRSHQLPSEEERARKRKEVEDRWQNALTKK